jgi:hypothetical protein
MVERWTLKPEGQHTVLQKTWYQPEQLKWRWLPIARLVLLTAAAESDKLRKAWDRRCASDSNPSSA